MTPSKHFVEVMPSCCILKIAWIFKQIETTNVTREHNDDHIAIATGAVAGGGSKALADCRRFVQH